MLNLYDKPIKNCRHQENPKWRQELLIGIKIA